MDLRYQDKNLIVTYLQIFLREYSGLTVKKIVPKSKSKKSYYIITNNDTIRVTGYYNAQTYTALALYMAYNYPNEGFPTKWKVSSSSNSEDIWSSEDYNYTGNKDELLKVISDNLELLPHNREVIKVPERVLSYIFDEVVTPSSSPEEILRIKLLLYDIIKDTPTPLQYSSEIFTEVEKIQQSYINLHTTKYSDYISEIIYNDTTSKYFIRKQLDKVTVSKLSEVSNYSYSSSSGIIFFTQDVVSINSIEVFGEDTSGHVSKLLIDSIDHNPDINKIMVKLSAPYPSKVIRVSINYQIKSKYYPVSGMIELLQDDLSNSDKLNVKGKINEEVSLPEQYKGFKVTGYVDPWTELLIKEGIEKNDY